MKAIWKEQVIAESDETILIEGNHYFPPNSVNKKFLTESDHTSVCPWKGDANYHNITTKEGVNENAAWFYPAPKDGSIERVGKDFTNYIAFWNGVTIQ
jgi:uncharacterized protein (DUF427 family)